MNVNTVDVDLDVRRKMCFFILSVVISNIWTPSELQLMVGVEGLCHIFEWGREMKKVGNHWPKVIHHIHGT